AIERGSRAVDILMILLNRRGAVVSRREIQDYVWPSMIVEESNLRVQMATLRKALGPDRDLIKTIPGRGYLFVAENQAFRAST
ncbi:winged helix-turn-helix domain-containing protein, partial [Acinetobacter baumannii]|uniref:winged helix-turn-helix domain-containing protein n=1 Tax=Acinetobacter baumannii TaxID=470 RepID=UPI00148A0582